MAPLKGGAPTTGRLARRGFRRGGRKILVTQGTKFRLNACTRQRCRLLGIYGCAHDRTLGFVAFVSDKHGDLQASNTRNPVGCLYNFAQPEKPVNNLWKKPE